MTFSSSAETQAIIDLLFEPNEDPLFIDGTAPLEDIVRDPDAFLRKASERFHIQMEAADLKLTIPQLAERIRHQQKPNVT
jgi:hypothetical protein